MRNPSCYILDYFIKRLPVSSESAFHPTNASLPSPWLAGLNLSSFPGPSLGEKVAQAAHAIDADILSPSTFAYLTSMAPDHRMEGFAGFASREMVREAKRVGMDVKVWTVRIYKSSLFIGKRFTYALLFLGE